jgi:peptidyl-tRNA hydrolase
LPAEVLFTVPEVHHRRIIGAAGKNIQGVMKNYGVYVKFMGSKDFAKFGGRTDFDQNVLARTPAKNYTSLEPLKYTLMDMADPVERKKISLVQDVPLCYHRLIMTRRIQLASQYGVKITMPDPATASTDITVFGTENEVRKTLEEIRDLTPEKYAVRVLPSAELTALASSAEFKGLCKKLVSDGDITIVQKPSGEEQAFIVAGLKSQTTELQKAIQDLTALIRNAKVCCFHHWGWGLTSG